MGDPEPGAGLEGGGALSARTLALAAGVVANAARRAAPGWDGAAGAAAQGWALARRATALGRSPASAPGPTRDYVLGDILERAARSPLDLARAAADTATLGAHVAEHAPGQPAADAIAAAAIAAGAARAAAHLVAVNLATRTDDAGLAEARSEVRRASAALPEDR